MRDGRGNVAPLWLDALRREQLADELTKHDRLAVRNEIRMPRTALGGAEDQPLDRVIHVRRRSEMTPAANPRKAARAHELDHRRQQCGIAAAPNKAGTHDNRLKALAACVEHLLLGARLRR